MPINISTRTPTLLKRAIHEKKKSSRYEQNNAKYSSPANNKKKLCIHAPMRYPNIHHDD